jgi:hypothetical protein
LHVNFTARKDWVNPTGSENNKPVELTACCSDEQKYHLIRHNPWFVGACYVVVKLSVRRLKCGVFLLPELWGPRG